MRFLGIDTETTGLDFTEDRITEIGFVVMEAGNPKPLDMQTYFVYEPDLKSVPEDITKLTGITYDNLVYYGETPEVAAGKLSEAIKKFKVDYLVAHNAPFDMKMLASFSSRHGIKILDKPIPVIDTAKDLLPELYEEARTRKLSYLAAHLGFLNPFAHAAIFDVATMFNVFFSQDTDAIIERFKVPWVVVAADVSYKDKDLAAQRGFKWQRVSHYHDAKVYEKKWVKEIKENELAAIQQEAPFKVAIID